MQIIDKSKSRYEVVKTIGSARDELAVEQLIRQAQEEISKFIGQSSLNFDVEREQIFIDTFFSGIEQIRLAGPELVLGKLFDEIGFNVIKDELFRHLVLTRLVYPVSKLKTVDYLLRYRGVQLDIDKIYRYLDKLHAKQKKQVQQISYRHTLKILGDKLSIVFYDVTTLYFEIADEDDLRKTGFSKDGKHRHPQIILGLLVSAGGYPLAYEIFEGNKFEGHTMLPVVEAFKKKYELKQLVIIADAGLLSADNVQQLQSKGYEYILGARIKNETQAVKKQILSLQLKDGQCSELTKEDRTKLIISYSEARAKNDAANRKRGLQKLEKAVASGRLTKSSINHHGYNKYLRMEGELTVAIDHDRYKADAKWDGLKGYLTNTSLTKDEVIENYRQLWHIEKAFRISKTDLRIRPIYHHLQRRIEAHICIAFCAYKIYRELDRQLKEKKMEMSPEKAIDVLKTIYEITFITPYSRSKISRLFLNHPDQKLLLDGFGCPSA